MLFSVYIIRFTVTPTNLVIQPLSTFSTRYCEVPIIVQECLSAS